MLDDNQLTLNTGFGLLHNYEPKRLGLFDATLEADLISFEMLVVVISDYIVWVNNDIEEAISRGFLSFEEANDTPLFGASATVKDVLGIGYAERVSRFVDDAIDFNLNRQHLEFRGYTHGQTIRLSMGLMSALDVLRDIILIEF